MDPPGQATSTAVVGGSRNSASSKLHSEAAVPAMEGSRPRVLLDLRLAQIRD